MKRSLRRRNCSSVRHDSLMARRAIFNLPTGAAMARAAIVSMFRVIIKCIINEPARIPRNVAGCISPRPRLHPITPAAPRIIELGSNVDWLDSLTKLAANWNYSSIYFCKSWGLLLLIKRNEKQKINYLKYQYFGADKKININI